MNSSIIAVCDIPKGICSVPGVGDIDIRRLLENSTTKTYFHVEICSGYLSVVEKQVGQNWARFIAIAKNCHEQNVELTKSPNGLILITTRFVKASDELLVWIGGDLLSELEFPFLTPINIKGNQAYHCHKCEKVFKNPNPLKVHLSYECKSSVHPIEDSDSLKLIHPRSNNEFRLGFEVKDKFLESHRSTLDNNSRITLPTNSPVPLLLVPNAASTNSEMSSCFGLPDSHTFQILNSFSVPERTKHIYSDMTLEFRLSQEPAKGLKPSTNMWINHPTGCTQSSPGHVCAYCGKVYSRKYGLKIHVRTHTGYKPLKCRYCFRPFSDPSNLNKHVRLHSESDTPYRCTICGKVLVRRRDLLRHIKSRHPGESSDNSVKQIF
ncbi:PR domain zinc finger protein 13 [Trichonephila inaurata madagascariensis]|uniref:PR domain zinc finger protein 13 n=1 Tax=Trichonephila inaurata madagascariensis TaxID=2747483 RepID=A0A8X6XNS5_9ARAC|nr:PR domain zinc finger protein 13 [Trichonephila inaurata madagascariensis]